MDCVGLFLGNNFTLHQQANKNMRDELSTFEIYDRVRFAEGDIHIPYEQNRIDSLINAVSPSLATLPTESFKSLTIKDAHRTAAPSSNNSTPPNGSGINISGGYHRSTSSSTSTLRPDSQKEDKQKYVKLPLTPQGIFNLDPLKHISFVYLTHLSHK